MFLVDAFHRHAKHECVDSMAKFIDSYMALATGAKPCLMFLRMWHKISYRHKRGFPKMVFQVKHLGP